MRKNALRLLIRFPINFSEYSYPSPAMITCCARYTDDVGHPCPAPDSFIDGQAPNDIEKGGLL